MSGAAARGGGWRRLLLDVRTVLVAFSASMVIGWAANLLRPDPLVFPYASRRDRMASESRAQDAGMVTLAEVRQVAEKKSGLFVDARETFFFEEGRLPGAINLPVAVALEGDFSAIPADRDALLIVYCSGGDCEDSRVVARALGGAGFRNVRVYEGGWDEWSASHP